MGGNKKTSPVPFLNCTKDTASHADGMAKGIKDATCAFAALIANGPGDSKDIVESTVLLSQNVGSLTKYLRDCLQDLATMGEAMAPVMESSPDSAPALMVNMMSTFLRQLEAYYRDVYDTLRRSNDAFHKGKAVLLNEHAAASRAPTPPAPAPDVRDADASATSTTVAAEAPDGDKPTRKKKKKRVTADGDGENTESEGKTHHPYQAHDAATPGAGNSSTFESHVDSEMSAIAAAAAAGAGAGGDRRRKKDSASLSAQLDDGVAPGPQPAAVSMDTSGEPAYVRVGASVDDSMGRVNAASRPGAFSRIDTLRVRPPLVTYYIRLVRPGSLAYLVASTCVKGDEDIEADLFCDVLETEEVELVPFASSSGEVVVDSFNDLAELPMCAWRSTNSEDHTSFFYTMYLLTTDTTTQQNTLYLQDCVVMRGEQEEVLHTITVMNKTPQYAQVKVHSLSSTRSSSLANKAASIMNFERSAFAKAGFAIVPESEVTSASPPSKSKRRTTEDIRERTRASGDVEFNPNVQLASLDQPAAGGNNFNLGNVASNVMHGAFRGGKEVLKAPFSVGKAVLDVTGVSGAMRTTMENTFRRSFPDLEGEEIVDCYASALQDGGLLRQGYLYITTQYLCFVSTVSNAKFALEYDEIKDVQKSKSAKVFDNAITVTTHLGTQYFIGNLLQRDQTYSKLMEQWVS